MNVLHLTHTDINSDSRILKEMICLSENLKDIEVNGIGVRLPEEAHKTKNIDNLKIYSINLFLESGVKCRLL